MLTLLMMASVGDMKAISATYSVKRDTRRPPQTYQALSKHSLAAQKYHFEELLNTMHNKTDYSLVQVFFTSFLEVKLLKAKKHIYTIPFQFLSPLFKDTGTSVQPPSLTLEQKLSFILRRIYITNATNFRRNMWRRPILIPCMNH